MKKLVFILKHCLVLLVLCIFPFCIALITEYAITGKNNIVSNYLVSPLTLIGAIISTYIFSKEKIVKIKIKIPSAKEVFCILGLGLSLKPFVICILHFTLSLNITNSSNNTIASLINSVLIAAIAEEIIFRGILTDVINNSHTETKSVVMITVFITSVLWAFSHLYGFSLPTLLLFIDGIIIGVIYHYFKNILLCIVYHIANNASVIMLSKICEGHWLQSIILTMSVFIFSVIFLKGIKNHKLKEA